MRIEEVINKFIDTCEERQGNHALITGVPTGFARLDQLTAGFQKSQLITICGAANMGKRSLALNLARTAAIQDNLKVSILSLNLSQNDLGHKLICSQARVDSSRIRSGFLSADDWNKLTQAACILVDCKIDCYFSNTSLIDSDIVIIDSFQRLKANDAAPNIQQEQISYSIANELKNLAIKNNIPVVVLSSLNDWQIEKRSDRRPKLTDFKYGYSALADLSDLVLGVYRDEIYNKDENNPNRGTAEIIVLKQRMGPTGTAVLTFLNSYGRFEELAPEPE